MKKDNHYDLDLTPFLGSFSVKAGDYTFMLPLDLPLSLLVRLGHHFERLGGALKGEAGDGIAEEAEEAIWEVLAAVLERADPPPLRPVREMFSVGAAVRLLSFLVSAYQPMTEGMPSTTSSPSPGGTEGPSRSETS